MQYMKITFVTLGCKVNQYETAAMEELLRERGHEIVAQGEAADAVVVNTCAVTAESARKSRQAFRRAKKQNPGAVMVLCGCFSQADRAAAEALGADYIGGSGERREIVEFLCGEAERRVLLPDAFSRRVFEELPAGGSEFRTRAMLKVQDGCKNFCTYCIIPYLRGPSRSLPVETAERQAAELRELGYREIVMTGIEISSYGPDVGSSFAELVERYSELLSGEENA